MKRLLGLLLVAALAASATYGLMSFITDQRQVITRKVSTTAQRVKQLEEFIEKHGLRPPPDKEKDRSGPPAPSPATAPAPVPPQPPEPKPPKPKPDPKPEPEPEPSPSPSPDCLPIVGCDPLPL